MKILIVVDMQNDFIKGDLGTPEAELILNNVELKIQEYQAQNNPIYFTRDTHYPKYLSTLEGKNLPIYHCLFMTEGWNIHDSIKKYSDDSLVIDKFTFGSLQLPELISSLLQKQNKTELDIEEIEIIGLCTDVCVIANAIILKTYFPNRIITVDAKCCAGTSVMNHNIALQAMKNLQINIINEEE